MTVQQESSTNSPPGLVAVLDNAESLHIISTPSHGPALVRLLYGHMKALYECKEDDPLLYAYKCKDHMPETAGLVIALTKWCNAVIDATPDQLLESGAQLKCC